MREEKRKSVSVPWRLDGRRKRGIACVYHESRSLPCMVESLEILLSKSTRVSSSRQIL